jgi:hypothetical protein
MPRYPRRSWRWIPIPAFGVILLGILLGDQKGRGQAPNPNGAQPAGKAVTPVPQFYPSSFCMPCHNQPAVGGTAKSKRDAMICRLTEWQDYNEKDKHQIAYKQLAGERSQNMIRLLGYKNKDGTSVKDGTTVDDCLRCHALPEVGGARIDGEFLAEGVTCVACHGPYQEWVREHSEAFFMAPAKNWIKVGRKEKEVTKGMTDLWDPAKRTEVCASCHIGDYKEKKIITHAMYAAGHPPLPSFEPANFSDFQPRHWQYIREKLPAQQARLQPFDESNLEHAELVASAGPALLRATVKLFADQAGAKPDAPNLPPGASWPDFARYDCRACHHELKSNANTQDRAGSTAPGRPGESKWAHVLTRLGISAMSKTEADAADQLKAYESLDKAFRDAMTAEPFGNRDQVLAAAEKLVNWSDALINNRSTAPVNEKRAWKLIAQLCDETENASPDYDSARQAAWAFRAIYYDLVPDKKKKDRDPEIESILDQLDKSLLLKLPSAKEQVAIEETLKTRLEAASNYKAADTAKLFGQLRELVAKHLR